MFIKKHLLAALSASLMVLSITPALCAEEPSKEKTQAPIEKISEALDEIIQLKFEKGNLALDKDHWEALAKKLKDAGNELPGVKMIMFNTGRELNIPGMVNTGNGRLFRFITSDTRDSYSKALDRLILNLDSEMECTGKFSQTWQNGTIKTSLADKEMSVIFEYDPKKFVAEVSELVGRGRSVKFTISESKGLALAVADKNGKFSVTLVQDAKGQVKIVHLQDGKTRNFEGKNFGELISQNRAYVMSELFELFSKNGIGLPLTPHHPKVVAIVLTMLKTLNDPEASAEGKKLIKDLNADSFSTRNNAMATLETNYEKYCGFIQEAVNPNAPAEVRKRIETILANHVDQGRFCKYAVGLKLTVDVEYLKALLAELKDDERATVSAALKRLGQ